MKYGPATDQCLTENIAWQFKFLTTNHSYPESYNSVWGCFTVLQLYGYFKSEFTVYLCLNPFKGNCILKAKMLAPSNFDDSTGTQ